MILITGGAGFIGSALAKELNNRGRKDLVIVDRLGDSTRWLNLRSIEYDRYIHADEFFSYENNDLMEEVSAIFHMGACSSTTEMDMDFLMHNNVNYSKNLYEFALEKEIPFIYASSAATYGAGECGYDDNESEIDKLKPLNPYGYSKQLFDQWVLRQESKPSHWFGLKFFNVYGPNEYHKEEMRSLVCKGFEQIKENGKVKLFKSHKEGFKDGEQLRDFVYIKDVVNGMLQMLEPSSAQHSGIYNMGTGKAQSFKELIEATFAAQDMDPNIEYIDMPEKLRKQYQYFTQANMDKFNKAFPTIKFKNVAEGVKDYVQNHLMQEDPFY